MGSFWRPEVLSNAYTGDRAGDLFRHGVNSRGRPVITEVLPGLMRPDGRVIPDAGAQAARLLVAKTVKAAHPKDGESTECIPANLQSRSSTHLPLQPTLVTPLPLLFPDTIPSLLSRVPGSVPNSPLAPLLPKSLLMPATWTLNDVSIPEAITKVLGLKNWILRPPPERSVNRPRSNTTVSPS